MPYSSTGHPLTVPGTQIYSGETEMHFDARRQQQHNAIKGLR